VMAALELSFQLAAITALLLLPIALGLGWVLAFRAFPGKALLETLVALPLVLPPTVLGYFVLVVIAPDTPIGRFWQAMWGHSLAFSFAGIVVVSLLYSLPFAVQPILQALRGLPRPWLELGWVQGLAGWRLAVEIVLPAIRRGIFVALGMSFAHTLGEFGAVWIVGGAIPEKTKVASIALFECVEAGNWSCAHRLAIVLVVVSIALLVLVQRFAKEDAR